MLPNRGSLRNSSSRREIGRGGSRCARGSSNFNVPSQYGAAETEKSLNESMQEFVMQNMRKCPPSRNPFDAMRSALDSLQQFHNAVNTFETNQNRKNFEMIPEEQGRDDLAIAELVGMKEGEKENQTIYIQGLVRTEVRKVLGEELPKAIEMGIKKALESVKTEISNKVQKSMEEEIKRTMDTALRNVINDDFIKGLEEKARNVMENMLESREVAAPVVEMEIEKPVKEADITSTSLPHSQPSPAAVPATVPSENSIVEEPQQKEPKDSGDGTIGISTHLLDNTSSHQNILKGEEVPMEVESMENDDKEISQDHFLTAKKGVSGPVVEMEIEEPVEKTENARTSLPLAPPSPADVPATDNLESSIVEEPQPAEPEDTGDGTVHVSTHSLGHASSQQNILKGEEDPMEVESMENVDKTNAEISSKRRNVMENMSEGREVVAPVVEMEIEKPAKEPENARTYLPLAQSSPTANPTTVPSGNSFVEEPQADDLEDSGADTRDDSTHPLDYASPDQSILKEGKENPMEVENMENIDKTNGKISSKRKQKNTSTSLPLAQPPPDAVLATVPSENSIVEGPEPAELEDSGDGAEGVSTHHLNHSSSHQNILKGEEVPMEVESRENEDKNDNEVSPKPKPRKRNQNKKKETEKKYHEGPQKRKQTTDNSQNDFITATNADLIGMTTKRTKIAAQPTSPTRAETSQLKSVLNQNNENSDPIGAPRTSPIVTEPGVENVPYDDHQNMLPIKKPKDNGNSEPMETPTTPSVVTEPGVENVPHDDHQNMLPINKPKNHGNSDPIVTPSTPSALPHSLTEPGVENVPHDDHQNTLPINKPKNHGNNDPIVTHSTSSIVTKPGEKQLSYDEIRNMLPIHRPRQLALKNKMACCSTPDGYYNIISHMCTKNYCVIKAYQKYYIGPKNSSKLQIYCEDCFFNEFTKQEDRETYSLRRNNILLPEKVYKCIDCGEKEHKACVGVLETEKTFLCRSCKVKNNINPIPWPLAEELLQNQFSKALEDDIRAEFKTTDFTARLLNLSREDLPMNHLCPSGTLQRHIGHLKNKKYMARTTGIFQRVDGADILFVMLFAQEYRDFNGKDTVVQTYLDSVRIFESPKEANMNGRMARYLMQWYNDYAKRMGYAESHLWAKAPSEGTNYCFYVHPRWQKYLVQSQLLKWYEGLYKEWIREAVIKGYKTFSEVWGDETFKGYKDIKKLPLFDDSVWSIMVNWAFTAAIEAKRRDSKIDKEAFFAQKMMEEFKNHGLDNFFVTLSENGTNENSGEVEEEMIVKIMRTNTTLIEFLSKHFLEFSSLRHMKYSSARIISAVLKAQEEERNRKLEKERKMLNACQRTPSKRHQPKN